MLDKGKEGLNNIAADKSRSVDLSVSENLLVKTPMEWCKVEFLLCIAGAARLQCSPCGIVTAK